MKRFKRFIDNEVCEYADERSTDIYCMRKIEVKETTGNSKGYDKGCGRIGYGETCPYSEDASYDNCGCNTRKINNRNKRR